jgi:hypothetical protein
LRLAVLEEHTNIDYSHHSPFLSFRFFYAETLKKVQEGGREVIKLNIAVRRSLGRPGLMMMMEMRNEGTEIVHLIIDYVWTQGASIAN